MKCFPRVAVSALIEMDGKLLMVRRGHEPNIGLWSLPGGSIEPGETAREACAREVAEETSLTVEVGDVAGVRDVIIRDGDEVAVHYVIISFPAKVIGGELRASSDAAEAQWVPIGEIADYQTSPGLVEWLAGLGFTGDPEPVTI